MLYFSVIIPNYNHGRFLKQRIESILNQSYKYFEIIILDDASDDNSKEIIENYRGNSLISHIVYSSKNSGSPFKQWAKGIKLAKYDWIWIAESDDFASLGFLDEAVTIINKNENIGFWFCNSIVENDDGSCTTTSEISEKLLQSQRWNSDYTSTGIEEINTGLRYFSNIPNSSAVLFKKDIATEYLVQIENFKYCGDWFIYISILQYCDIHYTHKHLNTFRRTQTSLSIKDKDRNIVIKKAELFRILNLLYRIQKVNDKKKLLLLFIKFHIGIGFKTEGLVKLINILLNYFRINFWLTTLFIFRRLLLVFKHG